MMQHPPLHRALTLRMATLMSALCSAWLLCACQQSPSPVQSAAQTSPATKSPIVGADRDAHGCIGSAGYAWCQRENQCVRSWELATQKGFDNTPAAFEQYCAGRGK